MMRNVLLTEASRSLGKKILLGKHGFSFLSPSRKELDICSNDSVQRYCEQNSFDTVIHCAALARMGECEQNPIKAFDINTGGTLNLVRAIRKIEEVKNTNIRFIYISTDGVYSCDQGNYSESSPTVPYNIYGWSKLGGETAVRILKNFCILRTRFYDPENIPFTESAVDIITSSIEVKKLIACIQFLITDEFTGIINLGSSNPCSEFVRYSAHKPEIKKCSRSDIIKNLTFEIATNASMDISLMEKIIKL